MRSRHAGESRPKKQLDVAQETEGERIEWRAGSHARSSHNCDRGFALVNSTRLRATCVKNAEVRSKAKAVAHTHVLEPKRLTVPIQRQAASCNLSVREARIGGANWDHSLPSATHEPNHGAQNAADHGPPNHVDPTVKSFLALSRI